MKVLILSDLNSIHTKKWVQSLAKKGCVIHVFGLAKPKDEFYVGLDNVTISYADYSNQYNGSILSKLKYFKVIKQLKLIYKITSPDIVHAHYATSYGLLGTFLNHKSYFISVWGSDVYSFPKKSIVHRYVLKRNFRKATQIFSTSHDMAKETSLYTAKPIHVIPFGIDLDQFMPQNKRFSSKNFTIGVVKSLEDVYGINYLIQAFKIVQNKYVNSGLLIVGEGTKENQLKQQVNELKLNHVNFFGKVSHDKVPSSFALMDIVVIPSLQESFGVAAAEALACGKAVIASDVGGLPEIIVNGETGLLCPVKAIECIAKKIILLVENSELREGIQENGRRFVKDNYDWKVNVNQMLQFYDSVID